MSENLESKKAFHNVIPTGDCKRLLDYQNPLSLFKIASHINMDRLHFKNFFIIYFKKANLW
tara:strand:- start:735 stop:917 length:183 start_codon:yes stop_codon:yes gene_type:complete